MQDDGAAGASRLLQSRLSISQQLLADHNENRYRLRMPSSMSSRYHYGPASRDSRAAAQEQEHPAGVFSMISDGVERAALGVARRHREPLRTPRSARDLIADLDPRAGQMWVGAVPFDVTQPPCLVVPERLCFRGQVSSALVAPMPAAPAPSPRHQALDALGDGSYQRAVRSALGEIHRGTVEKVVLCRKAREVLSEPVRISTLLRRLHTQNSRSHAFAFDLGAGNSPGHDSGAQRWLVGASPEILVRKMGRFIVTNPLAGSAPLVPNAEHNARIASGLLASQKDRREHALVVESIVSSLSPLCTSLTVPPRPEVIEAGPVMHLSTLIVGELKDPSVSSLQLALELHPTPAVCGTPRRQAAQLLANLEGFDRGFFTGIVGYCDATGDGLWLVALRCGEVVGREVQLYAGAGIVGGSDPNREYRETEVKLATMRYALRGGAA